MEQPTLLRTQHHPGKTMDRAVWHSGNHQPQVNITGMYVICYLHVGTQ